MNQWFTGGGREGALTFVPTFEVKETKDAFIFKADLPGVDEKDIEITLTGDRLTVTGKRESEKREEGERFYTYERSYGTFSRAFTLPEGVNPDAHAAELKNGVLTSAAQAAEVQPKRIKVGGAPPRTTSRRRSKAAPAHAWAPGGPAPHARAGLPGAAGGRGRWRPRRAAVHRHRAAVGLHDAAHPVQPQPQPAVVARRTARSKRLEEPLHALRGDADAVVRHHAASPCPARTPAPPPPACRARTSSRWTAGASPPGPCRPVPPARGARQRAAAPAGSPRARPPPPSAPPPRAPPTPGPCPPGAAAARWPCSWDTSSSDPPGRQPLHLPVRRAPAPGSSRSGDQGATPARSTPGRPCSRSRSAVSGVRSSCAATLRNSSRVRTASCVSRYRRSCSVTSPMMPAMRTGRPRRRAAPGPGSRTSGSHPGMPQPEGHVIRRAPLQVRGQGGHHVRPVLRVQPLHEGLVGARRSPLAPAPASPAGAGSPEASGGAGPSPRRRRRSRSTTSR